MESWQLRGDPNLLRMLNLGEYHSNSKHLNISVELKAIQERFRNFPSTVKLDVSKNVEGNNGTGDSRQNELIMRSQMREHNVHADNIV